MVVVISLVWDDMLEMPSRRGGRVLREDEWWRPILGWGSG